MTKSELKTGMNVLYRCGGETRIVIGSTMSTRDGNGYLKVSQLNEDLTSKIEMGFDVMVIYEGNKSNPLSNILGEVVYDRKTEMVKKVPEYTMEEAIAKVGHEFKIKK